MPAKLSEDFIEGLEDLFLEWRDKPRRQNEEKEYLVLEFARHAGIALRTLQKYADQDKRVNRVYNLAREYQEERMTKLGLRGAANPQIVMAVLRNKHGYDKDQAGTPALLQHANGNVTINIVDDLNRLLKKSGYDPIDVQEADYQEVPKKKLAAK